MEIAIKKLIKDIVSRLFEIEKKTDCMSKQGNTIFSKYCKETSAERGVLTKMLDELLDDSTTFTEAHFRCFWQSGFIINWNLCDTKEAYIRTIKKYIGLYGKPLEKDTIMYKAVCEDEELFGSSWSKDWKSACNFATKTGADKVVSMVVPKGAKTIHIPPTFRFKESEDVIDTTEVMNKTLRNFAELKKCNIIDERKGKIVVGVFEIKGKGTKYLHKLDLLDSEVVISKQYEIAA